MKNLSEKAILINLKISHWSGKKDDKQVASDIEKQHRVTNAGRYKKNLIDDTELKEIHSMAAAVRNYVKENTLPWAKTAIDYYRQNITWIFVISSGNTRINSKMQQGTSC